MLNLSDLITAFPRNSSNRFLVEMTYQDDNTVYILPITTNCDIDQWEKEYINKLCNMTYQSFYNGRIAKISRIVK